MKKQMMDYATKELENELIRARVKINLLKYYVNQQLYQYRMDARDVISTPQAKLAISIWEDIIRRLNG